MSKQMRCHILDRQDQLEEALERRERLNQHIPILKEKLNKALKAIEDHNADIAEVERFITLLQSTSHIKWIEYDDLPM